MELQEFCDQFVACMVASVGFTHFKDGISVEEYARKTAPSYFAWPDERKLGPEKCASVDMGYWGEDLPSSK